MKCSVVINTLNRGRALEAVLEELTYQDFEDFEIVVVNGPSTDHSPELLEDLSDLIKVVTCPIANLCVSRNIGLAHASGEIVLFIDDDAIPLSSDWVRTYAEAFEAPEHDKAVILGSSVRSHYTEHYEFKKGWASSYGLQLFDASEGSLTEGSDDWFERVIGCNNAMRVEAIRGLGGFDENYAYYADETDLCLRVIEAGYEIKNLPDNTVRHFKEMSGIRNSVYDQRWDIIARSDMYYSLKNGRHSSFVRFFVASWMAWKKHYIKEIFSLWKKKEVPTKTRIVAAGRFFKGLVSGYFLALRKRKLGKFQSVDLGFKKLEKNKLRDRIGSKKTLAGHPIRRCLTTWGGRSYPEFEVFQVYYATETMGWSETNSEIYYYRKNERVTFEIDINVNAQTIQLRMDPSIDRGGIEISKLEILDGVKQIRPTLDDCEMSDLELVESNLEVAKFQVVGSDPQIMMPHLQQSSGNLKVRLEMMFVPSD